MSTCSPASSSSYDSNKGSASSCGDRPSTSDGFNKASNSSPAMARSVPSSHEATSPPETAASRDYVYFTTDMANQAVLDMEREKGTYGTLFEWHQRRRRPELEAQARPNSAARTPNSAPPLDLPQPASNATVPAVLTPTLPFSPHDEKVLTPLSEGPMSNEGRKGVKRKNEDDVQKEAKIAKTESGTAENSPLPPKPEENPLKKMELMTNSQQFHTILNDVVDAPAKKDERAAKLEKLDDIGKQVQVEQEMMKQREIMHQNYQMQMKRMQQQQPYMSPQYPMPGFPPGNPAMMPGGMPAGVQPPTSAAAGPFSAGAFPPGYPGLPNMPPMPGPYPPHFFPHGIPPGYPMSAPGKMPPFPSPGFPQPMAGMPPEARGCPSRLT
ncbi:unnamed protein product [Caenorhabditis auriculariae]|uniref:Uncharacterized protein n=1 Tax=Caenorhabditis auriculariae TaxID=2777116 RepID=A0A8S1HSY5_9PELO|nr:unnamed protein product [Caenorhabditis auriculariae]